MAKLRCLLYALLFVSPTVLIAKAYPASVQMPADNSTAGPVLTPSEAPIASSADAVASPATPTSPESVEPPESPAATDTDSAASTPDAVAPPASMAVSENSSLDKVDSGAESSHPAYTDGVMALFGGSLVVLLLVAFAGLLLYMLPTIIARSRGHRNTLMIGFLNLFTGWTFLGWIGCLVWSVVNPAVSVPAQTGGKV